MREERATKQAVEAAIKELEAHGAQPTADRILEITGGSKSTVLRHMKDLGFGASRRTNVDTSDDLLPGVLLEKAKPFIAELLASAAELERAKYLSMSERFNTNMEELEIALAEDGKRLDIMAAENTALSSEIINLREDLEIVALERDELQQKSDAAERRARIAEARISELEAVNGSLKIAADAAADLESRMVRLLDERFKEAGLGRYLTQRATEPS
jgi:hypothetical protein